MKYLQSFFESSRVSIRKMINLFSHLVEVIKSVEDLSVFLKDEGFEIGFGIMPAFTSPNYANFEHSINDIQIKMVSLGKMVAYFRIDFVTNKSNISYQDNGLNEIQKDLICDTILSIVDLFEREDITIINFWYKSYEFRPPSMPGWPNGIRTANFSHTDLSGLQVAIRNGSAYDIRIAFTGQKLLDSTFVALESLTPKLEMSELMDIEEIVKDYNEELDEVTISASYVPVEADDVQEILYIIINSIEGFDLYLIKDFLLTLMNHIGVDNLDLKIVYLYDSWRQPVKVTKKELEIGTVHTDKIVSIVITFDL